MIPRGVMNVLFVIGAVLCLVSFGAIYVIINSFIVQPTVPSLISGETIPFQVKGKTMYITKAQKSQATAIFVGESVGLVVLLVYGLLVVGHRE
jgi:hypothetical protein